MKGPIRRPNRPTGGFSRVRVDGDLLNVIARVSGEQVVAPPTALVADYPSAADSMVEMNNDHLEKGRSARLANKEGLWPVSDSSRYTSDRALSMLQGGL